MLSHPKESVRSTTLLTMGSLTNMLSHILDSFMILYRLYKGIQVVWHSAYEIFLKDFNGNDHISSSFHPYSYRIAFLIQTGVTSFTGEAQPPLR